MVVGITEKVDVVVPINAVFTVFKVPPTVVVPPVKVKLEPIKAMKPAVVVKVMLPATLRLATDELIPEFSNESTVSLFIKFKLGTFIVPVPLRLTVKAFPSILLSTVRVISLDVVNVPFTTSPIVVA